MASGLVKISLAEQRRYTWYSPVLLLSCIEGAEGRGAAEAGMDWTSTFGGLDTSASTTFNQTSTNAQAQPDTCDDGPVLASCEYRGSPKL